MFTLDVDQELELALVHPKYAKYYLEIVTKDRDYLSQWLAWPPHANDEAFFHSFIKRSLNDYAEGRSLTCTILWQGKVVGTTSFNKIDQIGRAHV